ncbi:uncharacterized protein LOC34621082 [Cyclospora cayetanensis]|uniref:Uncharacterized protein LOC34621082 n=1 Tax=Cyclospora cayetanensis TaxID=88456 RepID=A0A6P6RYA7_9EIME|nr:uncharacterized protein LOC34621082 [Cyclospora cayetanensis]
MYVCAAELFAHYLAGKPLASCSVALLSRSLHGADILIEVQNVSPDLSIRRELTLQLSRMRQRLQCGPIQRFLRSIPKRRPGELKATQLRSCERLWLLYGSDCILYSIHRFVSTEILRWSLMLKYCQAFAKAATEGPKRLPAASASIEPPEVIRGFSAACFSEAYSAATRSLRAITLSEMLISVQPHIEAVVRKELIKFHRLSKLE